MADSDTPSLTALTAPAPTDIIYIVDDPGGTPLDRKVTLADVFDSTFGDLIVGKSNTVTGTEPTTGAGYVILGEGSAVSGVYDPVVIGSGITVDDIPAYGVAFPDGVVCIGNGSAVHNGRGVAVGHEAFVHSVSGTAVGALSAAWQSHDVALGRGAQTLETAADSGNTVLGSATSFDLYFANGMAHRFTEAGTGTVVDKVRSTETRTLHGGDSFDDVDASDTSQIGGDLALAGGRGTGTADGGSVLTQVARAGGVSNNTKNTLVTVMELDTDNTNDQTAMLLWADGSLQRVTVGATDSGGSGYRVLRIPN